MEKVRLNKKKCQQGLDGMKFELILGLEDKHLYLPPEELKNGAGKTIASLECIGGKVTAYVLVVFFYLVVDGVQEHKRIHRLQG